MEVCHPHVLDNGLTLVQIASIQVYFYYACFQSFDKWLDKMNIQFVQSIFRIPNTFCQTVFGSLFCVIKHLLELNATILPIFAIIPIDNNVFIENINNRCYFSKVEENFISPFFIHTMKLANFTFYILLNFLDFWNYTCFLTHVW
jgi:hypothetical protein